MRSTDLYAAMVLAVVVGCDAGENRARDSLAATELPVTVNCADAAQLRDRAARDQRASRERASDQEKIDLASRARFLTDLATIADLRCKVSLADANEIISQAITAARDAEETRSFYERTLKWQETAVVTGDAIRQLIKALPDPAK